MASSSGRSPGNGPDSLCVIRLSAIGDCCHTLPVLRTIQSAWPGTQLTWIIGTTEHALMSGVSGIEFITFDKSRPWASLAGIRSRLAGRCFPLLLDMHASMRANIVSLVVPAARRVGFDRARARDYQWLFTNERIAPRERAHVMDGLFGFAEHIGIRERELRWDIPVGAEDRAFADALGRPGAPLVVVSPCGSQRFRNYRNWSAANYAAVAGRLHADYGAELVLTGGPTAMERDYGAAIEESCGVPVTNLIGRTSLKRLLAVIDRADLLICPDSGPAHMATAVGTPVVGLYATSDRHRTGPYFSQDLVVDAYPEAVRREFGVPVSQLRFGQRVRDPQAMDLIRVEDVVAKAGRVLRGRAHAV